MDAINQLGVGMAGSYKHCVDDDGRLLDPQALRGMLENGGDVWEAVEELYGMVWLLATIGPSDMTPAEKVEFARRRYTAGLSYADEYAEAPGEGYVP
ncbi:hypothetical protein [Kineosporia babensis]|uniref:Uncharacterized protein n=1 Tax=Kineosporia babensis TaxID=499548 RepID=A0A9X1NCN4_9ACTN|nr:hypothetical protein [Kineosporia babensis]MCD5310821.1 hypothetical protein [Kineosporia babensis]